MKVHSLIKAFFVFLVLSNTPKVCADGWFSDLMVRVPKIGQYWMNDTQKQIYSYEQKKKEAEQIKKYLIGDSTVSEAVSQLQGCNALPVTSGDIDYKMLKARFEQYVKNTGVINTAHDFSKTKEYPITVPKIPQLILTGKEIFNVNECAKNSNIPVMKKLSRFIDLTDDINTFRKSELYRQHHIPVTKINNQLKEDIDIRSKAYTGAKSRVGATSVWTQDQIASKEYRSEVKQFNPSSGYYIEVLRAHKSNNDAVKKHIKSNLDRLKAKRSALPALRKKINN